MIEVLWHGRGGQGAFTAARLLGAAASMEEGAYALAFPSFGPERRGAPMRAFTKMSTAPIGDRSAITQADYVIYLDDTLLAPGWDAELKPGGMALVNSAKTVEELLAAAGPAREGDGTGSATAPERLLSIDANGLSSALLGRPIPNTVFLGALSLLCDQVPIDAVNEAVRQYMPAKLHEKNLAIVAEARHATAQALAARAVARQSQVALQAGCGIAPAAVGTPAADEAVADGVPMADGSAGSCAPAANGAAASCAPAADGRPGAGAPAVADRPAGGGPAASEPLRSSNVAIPRLRESLASASGATLPSLEPCDYAQSTCYPAGHLVTRNAGWRNERPVLAPQLCTGCLQCYLYCPDGTIVRTGATKDQLSSGDAAVAAVAIDYDFCKGCGICVKACRFDAIAMIPEEEARAADALATQPASTPEGAPAPFASPASSAASPIPTSERAAGESLTRAFLSDYESEGGAR